MEQYVYYSTLKNFNSLVKENTVINITAVTMRKFKGREELDVSTEKDLFPDNTVIISNDREMLKLIKKADPKLTDVEIVEPIPDESGYETGTMEVVPPESVDLLLKHLPEAIAQSENAMSKSKLEKLQGILTKYQASEDPDKYLTFG